MKLLGQLYICRLCDFSGVLQSPRMVRSQMLRCSTAFCRAIQQDGRASAVTPKYVHTEFSFSVGDRRMAQTQAILKVGRRPRLVWKTVNRFFLLFPDMN